MTLNKFARKSALEKECLCFKKKNYFKRRRKDKNATQVTKRKNEKKEKELLKVGF